MLVSNTLMEELQDMRNSVTEEILFSNADVDHAYGQYLDSPTTTAAYYL